MKYNVYVIQSLKDKTLYVGLSEDPEKRLIAHNQGQAKYTSGHKPYKLVYTEICDNRVEARKKEKYYKSGIGREVIKKFIPQ